MNKHPGFVFSRTNRYLVFVWPLLALLLTAALWIATVVRADAEHARAEAQARKDASAYAEAYEQYITRSVGQMDQITMQLKFSWEHGRDAGLIDELRRDGMFTDAAFGVVAIVDRDGMVQASTRPALLGSDLSAAPYFVQHRNHISTALRVGAAPPRFVKEGEGGEMVLFTRRLDTRDDEFDGIVLMAVDARYFTSFVSPATLGAGGVAALARLLAALLLAALLLVLAGLTIALLARLHAVLLLPRMHVAGLLLATVRDLAAGGVDAQVVHVVVVARSFDAMSLVFTHTGLLCECR